MENEKILVLLVNYFNEDETSSFIKNELLKQSFRNVQIAVVNNGANDKGILGQLADRFLNVHLYEPPENLGYAGGAYFGLKKYLEGSETIPDFVIMSNSDIHFTKDDFFEHLVLKHKNSRDGIIGPSIYSSLTQSEQNPMYYQRINKFKLEFLRLVFSSYVFYFPYETLALIKRKIISIFQKKKEQPLILKNVYAIHGSFMIFTKNFFAQGGHLNYGSFLFGEEIFFAELSSKLKLNVCYDNSLKIIHAEHTTTRIFVKRNFLKYYRQSLNYLLQNYFK